MDEQYECTAADGVFTMRFKAPRQLLLHEEFEAMVWDECLRHAHIGGHMPVGPILIETSEVEDEPVEVVEGEPLKVRMQRWAEKNMAYHVAVGMGAGDFMIVTASVQLGLSLG